MIEYAIYKGDTFMFIAPLAECAKRLGVKEDSVRFLATPTGRKRFEARKNPSKCYTAVKLMPGE
ncbi:hypothetical protein ACYSNU_17750 [Enterococcus sp. LJL120]